MTRETYALRMATRYLHSLEHYGDTSPAVGDGRVSTPAYYASKLGNMAVLGMGMTLPGEASDWWGYRYKALALKITGAAPA